MKRTLTALTVAATMFASSAYAFDPADLQKMKDTGNCVQCDLKNSYLIGAGLITANIIDPFATGANLMDADLMGANLRSANLTGANLFGVSLRSANLTSADLNGADLETAEMRYARMKGVILCNTTMPDGSVIYSGC